VAIGRFSAANADAVTIVVTVRKERKMATETKLTRIYVLGDRPAHDHTCPEGNHPWKCNSPYCEVMRIACPEHGGPEPYQVGREPWRGR
jgi:hypothetical protein